MYYEASPPCEALINLANTTTALQNDFYNDDGWKTGLPWIYYQNTATEVLNNRNRIKAKMTMSTKEADSARYAYIPFKLAKYSLEGEFLGWEDLSNQIWMCPISVEGSERYRRVGLGLAKLCEFDLNNLVDMTTHLDNLNNFFELFLVDYNGDLIDVPILITNFLDGNLEYPNGGGQSNWRLTRRFFLYENVSAIEGTGEYLNPTKPPTYVRFIHESRLVFDLDTDSDDQILVPYLWIRYKTIATAEVSESFPTPIVVVTQWKMNADWAQNTSLAIIIVFHIICLLWIIWKVYLWIVLHPQNYESSEFLFYVGRYVFYE